MAMQSSLKVREKPDTSGGQSMPSQFSAQFPALSPVATLRARSLVGGTALLLSVAGASVTVHAQTTLPAGSPGRFTMHPADGGVLRLDTQTGVLSMCRQSGGQSGGGWSCAMMPDDRAAVTDEIERLKAENSELKTAVKRLEEMAGVPAEPGSKPKSTAGLPTEEELDKAMSYVQRMLKKFKDKIKELEGPDGKKGTQL
jgi:hypothetical protein